MSLIRSVVITPNPLVAGKQVTGILEVADANAIASAKLYDPRGYELRFQRTESDGRTVFRVQDTVPYDADPGIYYATVVITDTDGNVERKSVELRIA